MSAKIVRFPQECRTAAVEDYRDEPAVILILPTVSIVRTSGATSRRRRHDRLREIV